MKGCIAPAGNQMICEALHLDKPILTDPEQGQYEQRLNAEYLEKSGRGMIGRLESIEEDIQSFLSTFDQFPLSVKEQGIAFLYKNDTLRTLQLIQQFLADFSSSVPHSLSRGNNWKDRYQPAG